MKVIAISAGGKTTIVNMLKERLDNVCTLHFDDYTFEGEVDNFHQWVLDGADYNVWNLKPLEEDIFKIKTAGEYKYLLLDYPFAYCNEQLKKYIDKAIFIDTPLDIALSRCILRDMGDSSGDEIRNDLVICKADNDEREENISYLSKHIERQNNNECAALLAIYEGEIAGYGFVYFNCRWGALKNQNIPGIVDLVVFEKYKKRGVATKLMDEAEKFAREHGDKVYLDVCLNGSYGPAQILYIKRGYIPDGKGMYYEEEVCEENMNCVNNDELTLCLVKDLY